jgi:hypothetical protein
MRTSSAGRFLSAAPIRKDHITDWITNNTAKGLKLQSYAIEQLDVRVTGDIAINHLPNQSELGEERQRRNGENRRIANHAHLDQD